jgi:FAD:protein FMN transferase
MALSFTYAPSDGGRVHNPYLAVWIEDAAGTPLRTLNVTMQGGTKGQKYLKDLRRWFTSDQARISAGGSDILEAVTSPTRLPGATDLVWDGRNDAGEFVAAGSYTLCIEAARERGPYDLLCEELAFTGEPFEQQLADSGDLQQVTVSVRPVS